MKYTTLALMTHRDNLEATTTFEEYKAAHLEYINFLINYYEHKEGMENAINNFLVKTETLIKTAVEAKTNDQAIS